jgi:putative transposase
VPSDRTLYRLFGTLSHGRHVTGSASTRRSLAGRPKGTFGSLLVAAPGEVVQIYSTPLDDFPGAAGRRRHGPGRDDRDDRRRDQGGPRCGAAPHAKAVDASVLLARALTPEPVRPGWPEALRMSRSVLPYERLLAVDERLEQARRRRPVIVPDTMLMRRPVHCSPAPYLGLMPRTRVDGL